MNRAQRRNQVTRKAVKEKQQMAQRVEALPLNIQHGHTETHVAIIFDRPTNHIYMLPAEAEAFIKAMRFSIEKLATISAGGVPN